MDIVKVAGENKAHKVSLYTLSTCGWCKKTKQLLKESKIEYDYLDIDTASPDERREAMKDITARDLRMAFPIIIIDDEKVITGFREDEIREALGLR